MQPLTSFKGFIFIPLFSSTNLFPTIKSFSFTLFQLSDSLKGFTFKPLKLVNPGGLTSSYNLFLAILQSSLLWLNLPQCSQGVLPPNFQQFVIICPQLIGFKDSPILTKHTFSVHLPCLFLSSLSSSRVRLD